MRRLSLILSAVLGACLLLALGFWLFRLPLANWALAQWLGARALEGSGRIVRLDTGGAELDDLRLEGLSAGRIALSYDLPALIGGGRLEGVTLSGLALSADLTAGRPLGRLQEAFGGGAGGGQGLALPVLPPVELTDAELDLKTSRGPLRLALAGSLRPAPGDDGPARRLAVSLRTLEGPLRLAGKLDGLYRPDAVVGSNATLSLTSSEGPPVSIQADARLERPAAAPEVLFSLDLDGDAPLLAELATLPPAARPSDGRIALRADGRAAAKALAAGDLAELLLDPAALGGFDLSLDLDGLALPGRASGVTLRSGADIAQLGDQRHLRLRPAKASAETLDPAWLQRLGLPPAVAATLAGGADLTLDTPGHAPMVLRLGEPLPQLDLDLAATVAPHAGGSLEAALKGELSLPRQLARLPERAGGSLALDLAADRLSAPGFGSLERGQASLVLDLANRSVALQAPARLEGLSVAPETAQALAPGWQPLLARPIDLTVGQDSEPEARLVLGQDRWQLTLPRRLALSAGDARANAALDGTAELSPRGVLLASQVEVPALTASALPTPYGLLRSLSLKGRFEGASRDAQGEATLAAELDGLALGVAGTADLSAELPLDLAWKDQALTLGLSDPGSLSLAKLAGGPAALDKLALSLGSARLTLGARQTRLTAEAALAPATLVPAGSGDPLTVSAGRLSLDLTLPQGGALQGTARATGLELAEPQAALALHDGTLSAELAAEGDRLTLSGGRLVSTEDPALFPPLDATAEATLADGLATWSAAARGLAGALSVKASGRQDLGRDSGSAKVTLAPLTFAAGGPQPGDLSPALASLKQAVGSLSAELNLKTGQGVTGGGRVRLEGLGFTSAGAEVEGLDLSLALDSLTPPTSPAGQPFSIARIDVGTPLTDLKGTLALRRVGSASQLVIEQAHADLLGGGVALDQAVLDPASGRYDLVLQLDRIDLERLLAVADVEGVSGSGQLSGRIPLRIEKGAIVVEQGALGALEPGVIAFKSAAARKALEGSGQSVDLMLQALENFHYKVLRLSLDKPAEGESKVFLRLEGRNPDVMNGQPFVLNINLTSDVAPLLQALAQGTEISDRLVQRLLKPRTKRRRKQ
ncbi:Dicarboxylate transport [Tistlia consotensis]|uniref:Dicarboxylate transport n=1 Tax=Tistlia consotensis USBA 355 TaxID=560819 RepID=A0A1Y6CNZ4_9PROT|nr:YdbH domain-containing protein [Tistlia consotensis]SMF77836.1 Dicarboxylate transport [Tistlia consotensis USBA 355]SNS20372.1 Dicarboxylate transport [Tistlia consotensis]